jgi:hypothetical protein
MNSTLEKEYGKSRGLFMHSSDHPDTLHICFQDEAYILFFRENKDVKNGQYELYNRDTRKTTDLTKVEFFAYLDILIEMDRLRQERIKLRVLVMNSNIDQYIRDSKLKEIGL